MANNEINDKELDDYLKGDSGISSAYRASSKQEPSRSLDEKILSAANEALQNDKQESKKHFHKSPWAIPVSIAAMVTLSISLVVTMQQEAGKPLISNSEVEMFNSLPTIEETIIVEDSQASDEANIKTFEIEESDFKESKVNEPMSMELSADVEQRKDKYKEAAKKEMPQKLLLKEKVQIQTQQENDFNKQQVLPSAAPAFESVKKDSQDDLMSTQDSDLLTIKQLWQAGEFLKARNAFLLVKENYPSLNNEILIEKLGPDLYQALNNVEEEL